MELGQNIKKIRRQKRLSQRGLALKSGVSVEAIRDWERGKSMPTKERLEKVSLSLGVSNDILYNLYKTTDPNIRLYAFYFALGKRGFYVRDVVETLIKEWDEVSKKHRKVIQNEIIKAINSDRAGAPMDVRSWQEVLELDD